jgi:hypothetical protein
MIADPRSRHAWIPTSRRSLLIYVPLSLVIVTGAVFLALYGRSGYQHVVGWIGLLFLGGGLIVLRWDGFAPGRRGLELDPGGTGRRTAPKPPG